MQVHVAGSDPRQLERRAERLQERETLCIGAAGQELDTEPKAPGETLAQPATVRRLARQQRPLGLRQPQDQASFERILEIPALEDVVALDPRAPRASDQPGERAIARAIGRERHELERIDTAELRADDEWQLALLGRDVRAH